MIRFALKSLWQEKIRLALSIGGVAMAILVILILEGLFSGAAVQATLYINETDADVFVMQDGVANLHMASSFLPANLVNDVRSISGVKRAIGITYANTAPKVGENRIFSYIIGYDPDELIGGPWDVARGTINIGPDEAVLDEIIARQNGVGLGDTIEVMGREFEVAGLSRNTFSIVSSITFLQRDTLAQLNQNPDSINYILIQTEEGERPVDVARQVEDKLNVNALTKEEFSDSDRTMIRRMGLDVIRTMAFIALIVGLAVIGVTIYTATLDRSRDYGVLKAVGASRFQLYYIIIVQALANAVLGSVVGLALAYVARVLVSAVFPELLIVLTAGVVAGVFVATLAISVLAAVIPARLIDSIDPTLVFEGA